MKWPWVSRELANTIERRRVDAVDEARGWQQLYESESRRFEILFEKYHALRQDGYNAPPPVAPRQQKEIDPLTQAVLDASRGKPQSIRNAMLKQLNEDKKAVELGTMEVADVLRRIEIGFTPDDGIPE